MNKYGSIEDLVNAVTLREHSVTLRSFQEVFHPDILEQFFEGADWTQRQVIVACPKGAATRTEEVVVVENLEEGKVVWMPEVDAGEAFLTWLKKEGFKIRESRSE